MATAPTIKFKSQPLHNFSLPPHLRWAHKNHHHHPHSTHHRDQDDGHRCFDSPEPQPPPPPPQNDPLQTSVRPSSSSRAATRKPFSFTSCDSSHRQNKKAEKEEDVVVVEEGGGGGEENNEAKPWNLRPRKAATFLLPPTGSSFKKVEKLLDFKTVPYQKNNGNAGGSSHGYLSKSSRLKGTAGEVGAVGPGYGSERQRKVVEEKRKLWISLSKEEIEEDVYSLTGSRPSRKPKKRPKNVQKLLDNVFPALYLVGMSGESYRGHDILRLPDYVGGKVDARN